MKFLLIFASLLGLGAAQSLDCSNEEVVDNSIFCRMEDCQNYFSCVGGNEYNYTCPEDYHCSANQGCAHRDIAGCDLSVPEPPPLVNCDDFDNWAMVPHPETCDNYFQCIDGVAWEAACPRGMHFSPSQLRCMSYNEANCQITGPTPPTTPTPMPPPPPPAPSCEGLPDHRLIPHPNSCEDYFWCFNSTAWLVSCPRGLYFSEPIQTCDYPHNVNCVTQPPQPPPPPPAPSCEGLPDHRLLPHPNSCEDYFWCFGGNAWLVSCPRGLYFSEPIQTCDYPHNVNCVTSPPTPTPPTAPPPIDTQCIGITNNTRVPDAYSCLSFFECIDGRAWHHYCSEGLWFDEERLECDVPDNVLCSATTPPGTPPTAPTENPLDICIGVENGSYVGSNTFCERFYLCIDDQPHPDVCVDGYWFDLELQHCRPSDEVDCNLSTIAPTTTETTTTTETLPITLCHEARNGTYVANRMACNEFFVCLNEEPHPRRCQQGLWFSFIQQRCTTVYGTQCDLYPSFCLGAEDDVPFRAPGSCTDYVTCYDGVPYSSQCWNNLFFDEATGQCLPPDEVECDLINIPTEPPRTPCDGARDFGLVASWDSCEEYFLCYADEIWDTLRCPEGQIFNEMRQVCGGEGEGGFECWL